MLGFSKDKRRKLVGVGTTIKNNGEVIFTDIYRNYTTIYFFGKRILGYMHSK